MNFYNKTKQFVTDVFTKAGKAREIAIKWYQEALAELNKDYFLDFSVALFFLNHLTNRVDS